jgi:hypothetical protein
MNQNGESHTHMKNVGKALALSAILATLTTGGCAASAKVITSITSSNSQIKFLYRQGGGQGIIKCEVASGGALTNCREMAIVLDE